MSDTIDWPAPVKLNLFLHITGKRADGYHNLQTLFQLLDFGDSLRFTVREDGAISQRNPLPGVRPDDDLCVRAAYLLQQAAGSALGADIALTKRAPMGGGLGGGSSDAATVLCALNRLWNTRLTTDNLAALGLQLGADVPVFVRGRSAWADGVGEGLTPAQIGESDFLVIHPGSEISTAEIFSQPALTRDTPRMTIRSFVRGDESSSQERVARFFAHGRNDCEALVRKLYPAVDEALEWLGERAPARLTGTGACVFAPLANRAQGAAILAELPSAWRGFVARGVDISPLHAPNMLAAAIR